ncbi:MAG: PD-(D/E)XK nuclease family protein [bacterium]|nr:PD-(D/E)XK nuclease family protein [bacterium]
MEESNVKSLLRQVEDLLAMRDKLPKIPGADFNIFTALGIETKEVDHCRLLYELLCPNGSHGLGEAFLRDFCEQVMLKPLPKNPRVWREYAFDETVCGETGRIDLLIEGDNVCYPIEVKIYANDQKRQIERYYVFANERAAEQQVYYLTLDGRDPSDDSKRTCENVKCLSFAADVRNWLVRCGEMAWQAPAVSEYIRQYISLLDKLTGNIQGDVFREMISNTIGTSRENYESAAVIADSITQVRINMMRRVFEEIKNHIGERLDLFMPKDDSVGSPENYYHTNKSEKYLALTFCFRQCKDYKLALRFEIYKYLAYGLVFFKNDGPKWPYKDEELLQIKDAFSDETWKQYINNKKDKKNWWIWLRYLPSNQTKEDEKLLPNFRTCKNEKYLELYDPKRHVEIMNEVFKVIDENLDNIKKCGLPKCMCCKA